MRRTHRLTLFAAVLVLSACSPHAKKAAADPEAAPAPLSPDAIKNETAGAAFLKKNAMAPGVMSTPSGLEYKVVRQGPATGAHPKPADEVKLNYEGTLLDGTVFDSSYPSGTPVVFQLGRLIPGWIEGVQLMRPGDEFLLYVPAKLAYGDDDAGRIPPGSTLVFRIELLGVLPASNGEGLG